MHQGRFERADKGSLFLDELATTSALVQEKLLRIIEYGEYERVGGSKTLNVDVRLIAATNEDLPSLANAGRFREDLLDRLAFDVITLPPLRARAEDIILLAEQFAVTMASDLGMELFPGFSEKAIETLLAHQWPGNIRELKNVVERSVYRAADDETPVDVITLDPFDSIFRPTGSRDKTIAASSKSAEPNRHSFPLDFKQTVQDYEIDLIQKALSASQFNQKKTAETLGVTYHQLRGYMKKYELFEND
jgi:psp operon transcriptional activator